MRVKWLAVLGLAAFVGMWVGKWQGWDWHVNFMLGITAIFLLLLELVRD